MRPLRHADKLRTARPRRSACRLRNLDHRLGFWRDGHPRDTRSTVGAEIGRGEAAVLRLDITRGQVLAEFRNCVAHSYHAWDGDALKRRLWSMVDAAALRFDAALASRLGG